MEMGRDKKGRERHIHFGVLVVADKYGFRLTKDNYAIVDNQPSVGTSIYPIEYFDNATDLYVVDETKLIGERQYVTKWHYSDAWCQAHYEACMRNYDWNMLFYESLDKKQFEKKVSAFVRRYTGLKVVEDLKDYDAEQGYYLMVLDEYRQVYIGTTNDIKRRVQQHWSKKKKFDRVLFGSANESRISIDSFRALDTTRLYAYKTRTTYDSEEKYISFFPDEFLCNRIAGGRMELGGLQALGTRKKREL